MWREYEVPMHLNLDGYHEVQPAPGTVLLRVAPEIKIPVPPEEAAAVLERYGIPAVTLDTSPVIMEQLWETVEADEHGFVTVPGVTSVLGHTRETIRIPETVMLEMRNSFYTKDGDPVMLLTTNITAPRLYPGSIGPQTFEIFNQRFDDVMININDLYCVCDITRLSSPSEIGTERLGGVRLGRFTLQERGRIAPASLDPVASDS